MFFLTQIAWFFLLFVVVYIILRLIFLYVIYLFFTRIFNAKVKFRSGYSFFSIQDISIDSDELEIRCKLFKISVGVHTNMQLRNLQIKKGDIYRFKDVYLDAQRIVDRALPSKRFFHISIDFDIIDYQTEHFSMKMENIHSIHTDSQHSFIFKNCTFSSFDVSGHVTEYQHSIHFSGSLPEKIQIVRPMFKVKCDTNTISSECLEISAYSHAPTIWRTVISFQSADFTFPNFTFLNDIFIIKFSRQITISLIDSLVTFESLHIKNILRQFKIKINQVKLRHDKIKIKKIIGNSHVQFLRILNHLRWLLYTSCKIKKTELLIKLDNGELCDIVVLNFEERNKLDENNDEINENRRLSEMNDDSDEANFKYFNIFNKYFNSFNKHNIQLSEGEALVTDPVDIANGFHSNVKDLHKHHRSFIFDRINKEFAKADEVKMEMVAHRTLISSVHMSNIQINRKNISQFYLESLNVIYSNSETFQLYCQELYAGFSEKITSRDHDIRAIVKSLRIDELILNRSLTSENLNLSLLINKTVPIEESRKTLKSLFPKLADTSKVRSAILLDFDIDCSEMILTNSFSSSQINYSGKMAIFHNGSKLLTCGVIHCISGLSTVPLETFVTPAFWYISFESNTLKIKYESKKAVFRSIKGEPTAFTFESAVLYKDISQPKRQRNLRSTTSSNLNNEMNNDDYVVNDSKSISIFDFWTENVIPIGIDSKIPRSNISLNTSQFNYTNDSSNSLNLGTGLNLTSDNNLNLNINIGSTSNLPVFVPRPRKRFNDATNVSHGSKHISSQFDLEDSVFRPSQHSENTSLFQSKEKLSNVSKKGRQTLRFYQARNSVFMSPKLTSEFVNGSLFGSSVSMINFASNQSNISKKQKVSSFDDNIDVESENENSPIADQIRQDSSANIEIGELKGDSPFYETVRYKFECFNGEFFTNSNEKEKTIEFKFEKGIFCDIQYTNVTSKFKGLEPVNFSVDQIEWPFMKAFFADFKLKEKIFIAKSMSLNSNFLVSSFDSKMLGFSKAEIGQILFKGLSLDRNVLDNPNKSDKSTYNSPLVSSKVVLKTERITMNEGKFSFCAKKVDIPLTSANTEIKAEKVRFICSNVSSLFSFLSDMKTQFNKVSSDTIIMKFRPILTHLNSFNKNYLNHSIIFKNAELGFTPSSGQLNVFDICSNFLSIFRVSKMANPEFKNEQKESININNDDNNTIQKVPNKNREKEEIFSSKFDGEKDVPSLKKDEKDMKFHITLTFNEKEKVCPRFNISLNSRIIVNCSQKDAELFKEVFEAVFRNDINEDNRKFVFDSTSFLKTTLELHYYNPNDKDFDEDRKYLLDIKPIELHKQTKTFREMIRYIFDQVQKIVRTKVAEKKREIQANGNNYS